MNEIEKIEDAIYRLTRRTENLKNEIAHDDVGCTKHRQLHVDDMDLAIQSLQEKLERENPQPLGLEELKNMDGEPIWVMHFDGSGARWGIVKSCDYGLGLCAVVDDETACCGAYWFSEVVGTIAYRYKPEHIGEATNMVEGE